MSELIGSTRTIIRDRYAVLAPESLASTPLAGWEKASCQVMISPALGARFWQVLVTLQADGQCAGNTGANQYLIYLLEGPASILLDERRHRLEPGSYVYVPAGKDMQLNSGGPATRLLVLQKPYQPLAGTPRPAALVHHEREAKAQPLAGNDLVRAQALLPEQASFDLAIQLLTFSPGATLGAVTAQVIDQGLFLVRGQGVCRLNQDWATLQAGDGLWVGPYCPYWFAALGKHPATLLAYREANRDPI